MTICHGCRKQIKDSYITALGQDWHAACFRCAGCGRAIGGDGFHVHDNRPYHAGCYHERFGPRCAGCGQPITSAYTTALGQTWHPEHFVCAHCKRPFTGNNFYERNGRPYCERDFQEFFGRRCAAGNELIGQRRYFELDGKTYCEDHYWQLFGKRCAIGSEYLKGEFIVNGWDEAYCEAHAKGLPTCYSCQRVICDRMTGGGVRYGDGRSMCNRCRRTAIDQVTQGQSVLLKVRRSLARLGLDIGQVETPLQLADQQELDRRSNKAHSRQPSGMASHSTVTRNGQIIERRVDGILILHGLPEEHFAAIAAHELCHTYLFVNEFPYLEPLVEEGLCELTSHLWLVQQKTPEATFRLKLLENNDDPIYGDGYQAARRCLDRMSLDGLLRYVRHHARLPV